MSEPSDISDPGDPEQGSPLLPTAEGISSGGDAFAALMARRAAALAAPERSIEAAPSRDLIAFGYGGERYAVEVTSATAVVPLDQLVALPGVDPAHLGLVVHRGLAYALIDPNAALDRPAPQPSRPALAVLLHHPDSAIGVAADVIHGVIRHDAARLDGASATGIVAAILPDGTSVLVADALARDARLIVDHRLRPSPTS
ncbi:chemotaxis protein CheW [Xanthobacter sp. KR7-65]|uniref:chemotaxis protein CheW n=1 Tax=Xanthobacter sp. KR7-65 TaxID=3156612 RepID=UPI0032B3E579